MVTVRVCIGSACFVKGSYAIIGRFQELAEEHEIQKKVSIKGISCHGNCSQNVSVEIDDGDVLDCCVTRADEFFYKHILPAASGVAKAVS